ncbi:hypothetical protein [uncultured Limnohabitans sp.]|nr:hypothetical protein [uncultured Limnohabitans sp.]
MSDTRSVRAMDLGRMAHIQTLVRSGRCLKGSVPPGTGLVFVA